MRYALPEGRAPTFAPIFASSRKLFLFCAERVCHQFSAFTGPHFAGRTGSGGCEVGHMVMESKFANASEADWDCWLELLVGAMACPVEDMSFIGQ